MNEPLSDSFSFALFGTVCFIAGLAGGVFMILFLKVA